MRLAAFQSEYGWDVVAQTRKLCEALAECERLKVQILCCTEGFLTGYYREHRSHLKGLGLSLADGPIGEIVEESGRRGVYVAFGFCEMDGDQLYNSALLAGAGDVVGVQRKYQLTDNDKTMFSQGDSLDTWDTPYGRVGMMICYDAWFPEVARVLALKGARILLNLNCAAVKYQDIQHRRCQRIAVLSRVVETGAYLVYANNIGEGMETCCYGDSCVLSPDGVVLAAANGYSEQIVYADVPNDLVVPAWPELDTNSRLRPDTVTELTLAIGRRGPTGAWDGSRR